MDLKVIPIEKSLISAIKSGDLISYKEFYQLYNPILLAFVYRYTKNRYDSEEIVQEVFTSIWEKRESLNENLSFKSYLFTITKNKITDYFRKSKVENLYKNYVQNFVDNSNESDHNQFLSRDYTSSVLNAINQLPEKRKMVFILNKKFDLSRSEIAKFMNISENTVKNQLQEAIQFLREQLKNESLLAVFLIGWFWGG